MDALTILTTAAQLPDGQAIRIRGTLIYVGSCARAAAVDGELAAMLCAGNTALTMEQGSQKKITKNYLCVRCGNEARTHG